MVVLLTVALGAGGCATSRTPNGPTVEQPPTPPAAAAPTGTPTGTPTAAPTPSGRPTAPPSSAKPKPRYVFPVRAGNVSYHPTHSAYPGTDIFANCGAPVVAVTDGKVLEVSRVDRYRKSGPQGPDNGGRSVAILGADGVRYYGSHLTEVAAGLAAGVRVRAGQQVGTVGRTGNANNVCHLHFGISPPCEQTGDWWIRRGVVWPAEFLDAWRRNVNRSPAGEVRDWHRKRGCPPAP
ncbi:M23 family metallopeptidase [Solwaraspora sp. WMMD1047]|uniref:M23 family metallopeptidase n=1 Tax=Solwaraspora sp. WMMD1047 TaxID=3016102 RepID=UPI0024163B9A|nr:M23 family metallopeptidase [Solwaraspora sp. WMMD1047]MDG4834045.1 M23 family metallopeptidase [Solwaraspora sp. WMMD1047]